MAKQPMKKVVADLSTVSRRDLLRTLGPAAAIGLAGCLGGNGDDDGNGDNGGNGENGADDDDQDLAAVQSGGTLDAGMQVGIQSLDPRSVTGLQSFQISYNVYSKLLRWGRDGDDLFIVGDLAREWEWEDDTTLVMELFEDAVYHNGDPVTADDVVYTIETMYENPSHTAALMFSSEIFPEAVDEHTVSIDTGENPFASLEANMAFVLGVTSEAIDQEYDLSREPIGSGPFEFVEWVDGSHITLERFDDYWKADEEGNQLPYLDGIEFTIYPDDGTKIRDLETGGLDWIDLVPWRDVESVQNNDDLRTIRSGAGAFMGIMQFNTAEEPYSDINVRKAVLHAVDWDVILDITYHGHAERGNNNPLPPDLGWDFGGDDPYQGQDLELAQEYLEQAEVDHTQPYTDYVTRGYSHRQSMLELIHEQISTELGMQPELAIEDGSVVFEMNATNQFGITASGFNGMWDPDQIFSANLAEGAFFNYGAYENDELNDLLVEARRTMDRDGRIDLYDQMYDIYTEDAAKYYPYWDNIAYAMQPTVRNYTPLIDQTWYFERVWLDE
ncbi:ABC transporter substrate-binding protein [Halobacteria archaeon AArc-curdl1]|uniref:ABC transporter substrate-binding protein n=1 Tax=Natronosalvus hydrolyticus TaxID=2979988 RepID=A0AAP2Z6F2_9EURY|nr:ABC transporter substrate-binding protein [Halobacteria archaeon AArc-curdl1]